MKNREIKFRAWDNVCKEMFPNTQNHINDDIFAFGYMIKNEERFNVMQFIGRKDCNEKDIYEGDILKGNLPYENSNEFPIMVCGWDEKHLSFTITQINGNRNVVPNYWENNYEIIGNIFEHPELLKP